jgi:microcompartment protein CcmL/EutN
MNLSGPAIGLLELESIARGMAVADVLVKRAPVVLSLAEPVTPGKYLLLFSGGVAEVEESFQAGVEAAGPTLLDKLLLPHPARGLTSALSGTFLEEWGESIGVVETHTVAAALLAADAGLKRSETWMRQLHLARGIGGKGLFLLTGSLDMVEAALEGASQAIEPSLLLTTELIRRPHLELRGPVF